jgi:threonine/homoserine/homoserine lactone efflux protein
MNAVIDGVVLGFTLAFVFGFGPAFFALIQTALHRGFWQGILLAFGIFLNDLSVVTLSLLGSVHLIKGSENYELLGIFGGAILIVFGIVTFLKKPVTKQNVQGVNGNNHLILYVGKGFLLNLANPFVWLFWMTVAASATANFKADTSSLIIFFAITLSIIFSTDMLKVFLASRLKRLLTGRVLLIIHRISAIALSGFGIILIIRAVFNL